MPRKAKDGPTTFTGVRLSRSQRQAAKTAGKGNISEGIKRAINLLVRKQMLTEQ